MADPIIAAAPSQFSFGGRLLYGRVTGFNGQTGFRSASHVYPKRDGGREEDMGREQRRLDVALVFIGSSCARDYQQFENFLDRNRTALLVHPFAGKWTAFCKGPAYRVSYATSTNQIEVPVTFVESELDATVPSDTPDVATAAQNATGQQTKFQQTIALFIGLMAKAQTASETALNAIDNAVNQVNTVSSIVQAPILFVATAANEALGAASSIVGAIGNIQAASDTLVADVTSYIAACSDLFDGTNETAPAGASDAITNQLDTVLADVDALEAALQAAPSTPAGCAGAVADVEIMADACMTLADAIAAAQPPTAQITVPRQMSLLVLAQKLIVDFQLSYDALTYASAILSLNRIPNPAALQAGSKLTVPTA